MSCHFYTDAELLLQHFDENADETVADKDAVDKTSIQEIVDGNDKDKEGASLGKEPPAQKNQSLPQAGDTAEPSSTKPEVPEQPQKKSVDIKKLETKEKTSLEKKDKVMPKLSQATPESRRKGKKKQKKPEMESPPPKEPSVQLTPSVSDCVI